MCRIDNIGWGKVGVRLVNYKFTLIFVPMHPQFHLNNKYNFNTISNWYQNLPKEKPKYLLVCPAESGPVASLNYWDPRREAVRAGKQHCSSTSVSRVPHKEFPQITTPQIFLGIFWIFLGETRKKTLKNEPVKCSAPPIFGSKITRSAGKFFFQIIYKHCICTKI